MRGWGETCKHTLPILSFKKKKKEKRRGGTKRGNIHISRRQYLGLLEFTAQFGPAHSINSVWMIKRPPPHTHTPPPPPHRPPRFTHLIARTRACTQASFGDDTNDILFVMWTDIMYYGTNCFCAMLYARTLSHTHTHIKSERGCFILPLNVFPIDHCSKDVINNLKAWLTSTFPSRLQRLYPPPTPLLRSLINACLISSRSFGSAILYFRGGGEEINIKISADKLIYYQERNVVGISRRNES